MTLLDERGTTAPAVRHRPGPALGRARDLALGVRFGALGGREGWIRNTLTAVGVGLGVALLLITSSIPQVVEAREERGDQRTPTSYLRTGPAKPTATTTVWADISTEYRADTVRGTLLRADGDHPALPPGVLELPGPGEMLVSPALAELLASPEGRQLDRRLDYRVVGTVAKAGLLDPGELLFYAGSATLSPTNGGERTNGYGGRDFAHGGIDPILSVLATLIVVVLLMPVAVFIATAVRFGGDRRDRRLAALRLIGADARMTRRIAAGEALFGSVLGLLVGGAVFTVARLFAGSVRIWGLSAFPSDMVPLPRLTALIVLAVPVASVVVTLFALRSVVIEPLGVVRSSTRRRRRLWWRLLTPLAGVALLLAAEAVAEDHHPELIYPIPVATGAVLVLLGVTALLPWAIEAGVGRVRGGPVSWQLAIRGLQLRSDAAARAVSGIMVAVAGAIALQMVFAAMLDDFHEVTGSSPAWNRMNVTAGYPSTDLTERMIKEFGATEGVHAVTSVINASAHHPRNRPKNPDDPWLSVALIVGDCRELVKLARITSCADGDTFVARDSKNKWAREWLDRTARKGEELIIGEGANAPRWTLPLDSPTVAPRAQNDFWEYDGIYATPGAIDADRLPHGSTTAMIEIEEDSPAAHDAIRDTAARLDPTMSIWTLRAIERDQKYASIQTGLRAGATATMILIAASMLVSQIEQLRERRRLLSVLLAFGTRRSTLAWSVLWQTAVPVVLGTAVAVAGGLLLGTAMLKLMAKEVTEWWLFLPVAGTGAGVILLVTLLSLPSLWRLTRPDGLRTE
ncbi:FtsX-like permease family protein [Streptomyces sp. NPDC020965]|uniref:FtsX-like permease family protein n=1 Tax=Streptomyces sp. NPDC020965 TaxID=3365105 RepID=UPI0037B7AC7D